MLRPYRDVLALPGAPSFAAAGFFARLPISMLGIGTVLLVESATGSYAVAGAVAATTGFASVVAAPALARLYDRHGQRLVLRPNVALHAAGLVALVACAALALPTWTLFAAALVVGLATMQVGSLVRARWSALLVGSPRLSTAFSLESVLDELIFIVGPVAVTLLATGVHPASGLLVAAAVTLAGSLALASQRSTEPRVDAHPGRGGPGALRTPGLAVVAATFVAVGGIFGSAEVVAVAFTEGRGAPAAAGLVLALFALGSLVSGLAYGAVQWHAPPGRRFAVAVALLGAGTLPLALASSIPVLAAVLFVAGLGISPMVVAGFSLVEVVMPAHRLTEGLTWATSALNLGGALGAGAAGAAVDAAGGQRAFLVSVACGAAAVAVVLAGTRWLRTPAPTGVLS